MGHPEPTKQKLYMNLIKRFSFVHVPSNGENLTENLFHWILKHWIFLLKL